MKAPIYVSDRDIYIGSAELLYLCRPADQSQVGVMIMFWHYSKRTRLFGGLVDGWMDGIYQACQQMHINAFECKCHFPGTHANAKVLGSHSNANVLVTHLQMHFN